MITNIIFFLFAWFVIAKFVHQSKVNKTFHNWNLTVAKELSEHNVFREYCKLSEELCDLDIELEDAEGKEDYEKCMALDIRMRVIEERIDELRGRLHGDVDRWK